MWFAERIGKYRGTSHPKFSLCCGNGKVILPYLQQPPEILMSLLNRKHHLSKHFIENIRSYNAIFSFTSMCGKIDHSINQGRGPYTFRMGGQNIHRIGTLIPSTQTTPKFFYATTDTVRLRILKINVTLLQNMINERNPLAKIFRMARDRLSANFDVEVSIKLISRRYTVGRTYNHPTTSEVAALIEGDIGANMEKRDIIIQKSCDVFRLGISHGEASLGVSTSDKPREKLTLREWFAFRIQYRSPSVEYPTFLLAGRLFQHFSVDGYTMIESQRLNFLRFNQDLLRVDNYKNLSSAYMRVNYLDTMTICEWFGYPVLFITFTYKFPVATDVDNIISVDIPDPAENHVLHASVCEFMIHGPCGTAKPTSPCMIGKNCSKYFPKKFTDRTTEENGVIVHKDGVPVDNAFVAPYNPQLLLKYQAHINVEWCNQSRSIKYLFKYINKGSDRVTMQSSYMRRNDQNPQQLDEIKRYYDCQYLSACEDVWRIFAFDIHYRNPPVQRLQFHLPDEQGVVFDDNTFIDEVLEKPSVGVSYEDDDMQVAKQLLYCQFPTKKYGFTIGRLRHVPPTCGELYFMRIMLNHIKGPKCFEDIRTVNGVVYPTYREICYAIGIIGDDKEYIDAIVEASFWGSGCYLRNLFSTLLLSGTLSMPSIVWDKTWHLLSDDILDKQHLQLTNEELKNYALMDIETSLQINGSSLNRYEGMPIPDTSATLHHLNTLVMDELAYDRQSLHEEHENLLSSMRGVFFVYGYGGTGKTFIWRSLCAALRSKGKFFLPVASSGIAATLIPGGRTAHSRFDIPINVAKLIIWDKAPMTHKYSFEALDRSLKDVMRVVDERNATEPFGGKVVVFGGNFRQTLPVVPKGSRADIVHASLCSSYLWTSCKVLTLIRNMRLKVGSSSNNVDDIKKFSEWILKIRDGLAGAPNDGEVDIEFSNDVLIQHVTDPIASLVDVTYPRLQSELWNPSYLQERAILAPTHETVEVVNDYVLSLIPRYERLYLSFDEVSKHDTNIDLGGRVIRCTVLTGSHKGDKVHIARITLTPSDSNKFPVRFSRRQFPIAVCFTMTINKSQGQSLSQVSIYLSRPVFSHGQLYVAISRVIRKEGLKILFCDSNKCTSNTTSNVVYHEIFQYL
ncbi:hypothetical protein RND81_05G073600 [Saponaria officinalis]|uniref:ATP-dependent DNA helicase n=1 Tax=Saponaria officinalis TaxID=3572 RepID=A0AAW1KVF2_SAPOF